MPFSNPGTSVQIANTVALTTGTIALITPPTAVSIGAAVPQPGAIATAGNAAGSRLVDNLATLTQHTFTGITDSFVANCQQGCSFDLTFTIVGTINNNATIIVKLLWTTAGASPVPITYEINATDIAGTVTQNVVSLTDRCRGDTCTVIWESSNGPITSVQANFVTSSRPSDRPRIYDEMHLSAVANGVDLILGLASSSSTGVLAIGATAPRYIFAATVGRIFLRASNAVSACTFTCAWGAGAIAPFVLKPTIGTDTFQEIPVPNRPLTVSVQNTGGVANAQFALEAWTQDD